MSKILLVDIDTEMQNVIREMLKEHSGQVEIMTSGDAKEVLNIVGNVNINMIIVDLKMPDFEDFEFLSALDQRYPHIPVIVTTAFGTPDIELRIKRYKSCLYFAKPVNAGVLKEKIYEELNLGVGGQIHGIGLPSFLQMSEMEKTTCTLRITSDEKVGLLYLVKGELIAADTGLKSGNEAAFEIVGWENAVIEIEKGAVKKKKDITMPLMNILMEALSIKDDRENREKEKKKREKKEKEKSKQKKTEDKTDGELELDAEEETGGKPGEDAPKKSDAVPGEILSASKSLRRKRIKTMTYAALLVVILSVAGWFSWVTILQPKIIKKKYDDVLISIGYQESLDEKYYILEDYVSNNPESPFLSGAKKKMVEIKRRILENDYKRAIAGVDRLPIDDDYNIKAKILYNEYLEKHPEGPHVEEIKQKISEIDEVLEEKRFTDIGEIPSDQYEVRLRAINDYVENHPEGRYIEEVTALKKEQAKAYYDVLKKQAEACEKEGDLHPCIQMCSKFIEDYPESPQASGVSVLMADMQAATIMAELKKSVEEDQLDYEGARAFYAEQMKQYEGEEVKKSIRMVLAKLDKQIERKKAWEKIYSESKDKGTDIDKRIQSLEAYMRNDASKPYYNAGEQLLAILNKEKQSIIKKEMLERERKKQEEERLRKIREEEERLETEKKSISAELESLGNGRYQVNAAGTVSDMKTGLLWNILDTRVELKKCLTYREANAYVDNLELGGYDDWRLPTSHELLMLLNTEPGFHDTGARRYWTSESYTKGFHDIANVIERTTDNTWRKSGTKLIECCTVRAVRP